MQSLIRLRLLRLLRLMFLALVVLTGASSAAMAGVTAAGMASLEHNLTPVGAEQAGNADKTIPAWDGGMTSAPPGWTPAQGYTDPFSAEKPLYVITGRNAEHYAAHLSPAAIW